MSDFTPLPDGLYRITTTFLCAGFVVLDSHVVACAPILRKRLHTYWIDFAKPVTTTPQEHE